MDALRTGDGSASRANERAFLLDIIVIAVCGVICGADNWVEIELWGQENESWLRQFLALPNGIPSHDQYAATPTGIQKQLTGRLRSTDDRFERGWKSAP
jgi:hypothetical protein